MANNPIAIPIGVPCIIDAAVTAPAAGNPFCFQLDPSGNDFSALFQATGTVTTLSGDLQISLDGGTTYTTIGATFLTAAAAAKIQTPVVAGALYRFNYTTASGSSVIRVTTN